MTKMIADPVGNNFLNPGLFDVVVILGSLLMRWVNAASAQAVPHA